MRRTDRNNAICFKSLEQALVECAETYGCVDILCAGWPCQDNSIAGTRKGHKGERSGLWSEVRRLVGLFRPKWFIGENVPGLFSVNAGKDFWQVISDLDTLGYCVAWDVLDSQNFGVAQRRKRVFVIGSFGNIGAGKVLFEQESGTRDDKTKQKMGARGLCISTREGDRNDPTSETFVAQCLSAHDFAGSITAPGRKRNIIATTVRTQEAGNRICGLVAQTIGGSKRGNAGRIWEDTHIAEINPKRKRKVTGFSTKLDSPRGVIIGNAVTVNVAKWIGERIIKHDTHRQASKEGGEIV